jgi:hypothetical protein
MHRKSTYLQDMYRKRGNLDMSICEYLPPHYQHLVIVIERARTKYETHKTVKNKEKLVQIIVNSMVLASDLRKYDKPIDRVLVKGYFDYLKDLYGTTNKA